MTKMILSPFSETIIANGSNNLDSADPTGDAVASTANLLIEGFESADLTASAATLNTNNFAWEGGDRTGVVHQDGITAYRDYPVIYADSWTDGSRGDLTAKGGTYSLSVEYAADVNMAEQRFSYDATSELWLRYWVRVPENFTHNSSSPSNHKFLALWMNAEGDYSVGGEGSTVAWEFWNDGNNGSELAFHSSDETYSVLGAHLQQTPFISVPADRGRWMQVVVHVKAATTTSSNDGIIELHRRWEDETDFTQIHHTDTADIGIPSGKNGFAWGYFMGWANAAYAENTWWLIDEFEISMESLL